MTEKTTDVENASLPGADGKANDVQQKGCCEPATEAVCCEPEAKASCCEVSAPQTCGCV